MKQTIPELVAAYLKALADLEAEVPGLVQILTRTEGGPDAVKAMAEELAALKTRVQVLEATQWQRTPYPPVTTPINDPWPRNPPYTITCMTGRPMFKNASELDTWIREGIEDGRR